MDCPEGHYCLANSALPTPCPIGTFRTTKSGTSLGDCSPCTAGYYCPFVGMYFDPAEIGTYCPPGYYCLAGQFQPYENVQPAGKYDEAINDIVGASAAATTNCEAGWLCSEGTNTLSNPRTECPAGHYCLAGAEEATPCPAYTYNPLKRQPSIASCLPCPAGTYCDATEGAVEPSGLCAVNHWCPEGSTVADPNECPSGTYLATEGSVRVEQCVPCPAGHWCYFDTGSGDWSMNKCPLATYQPLYGQVGAAAEDVCLECPAGFYCDAEATIYPIECPAGKHSEAGQDDVADC